MKRQYLAICLFIVTLFGCGIAQAAQSPLDMLQQTSDQMLSALKQSSTRDTNTIYGIIKRILLPNVDLDTMSRSVVGANYWNSATPQQRVEFKNEFTHFVAQTYSSALAAYKDEKIKFYPIRGGVSGNRVQVNSSIIQGNGQNIAVTYQLLQTNGQWKIYDFSVEGVSLIQNYRSQFADVLASQGFSGLLQRLHAHNSRA